MVILYIVKLKKLFGEGDIVDKLKLIYTKDLNAKRRAFRRHRLKRIADFAISV